MPKTCNICLKEDNKCGLYTLLCCEKFSKICNSCAVFLHTIDEHCVFCGNYAVLHNPKTRFYYDSNISNKNTKPR